MKLRDSCLLLLIIPFLSLANDVLDESYDKLNQKYSACIEHKKRKADVSNTPWFKTLTDEQLKVALLELNRIATDRCVQSEVKDYTYILFMQSLKDGKIDKIKTWFDFNNRKHPAEYLKIRNGLSQQKIEELSHTGDFKLPFDTMGTYKSIAKE